MNCIEEFVFLEESIFLEEFVFIDKTSRRNATFGGRARTQLSYILLGCKMPLTRAQAAQEEINGNAEEQEHKESELEQVRSPFETELLTAVQEQRDLLKEYKDRQDGRVFEVVDILKRHNAKSVKRICSCLR